MLALHAPPATLATHFMTRPWRELQLTVDTFGNIGANTSSRNVT